jgi:hypothetical protein
MSIMTPTIKISRVFFRSVWIILKNFARNKAVHNFANSVGWKLIGPIIYQDLAPPLSDPNMNRLSNSIIEMKYKTVEIESKILFLVKIIRKKATIHAKRNISCFPISEV